MNAIWRIRGLTSSGVARRFTSTATSSSTSSTLSSPRRLLKATTAVFTVGCVCVCGAVAVDSLAAAEEQDGGALKPRISPNSQRIGHGHGHALSSRFLRPPIECSPTFNGVPVAATFLMHQALPHLESSFPGLDLSPVFLLSHPEFSYCETAASSNPLSSLLFGPDGCEVVVPVFERLSQSEERTLGGAGLRKPPVAFLVARGGCSYGCSKVKLTSMKLVKAGKSLSTSAETSTSSSITTELNGPQDIYSPLMDSIVKEWRF